MPDHHSRFFIPSCFTVFAKAGILLASTVLAFVAFQSYVTAGFLLETGARAEVLAQLKDTSTAESSIETGSISQNADDDANLVDEELEPCLQEFQEAAVSEMMKEGAITDPSVEMAAADNSKDIESISEAISEAMLPVIAHRKFEVTTLIRIFLGKYLSLFFSATIVGDMLGILWLYAIVFASTLAESMQIAPNASVETNYYCYLIIYAALVLPISCLNVVDQLWIQYLFLAGRMMMVAFMVGTLVMTLSNPEKEFFESEEFIESSPWNLADFRYLVLAFQTSFLSTAYQGGVPAIAAARRNRGSGLPTVFRDSSLVVFVSNVVVAVLTVAYFGANTLPSANLMWANFQGQQAGSLVARIVSLYVSLFAAVDGLAIFPLLAAIMGDVLLGAVFGERAYKMEQKRWVRTLFRLVGAGMPPIVGAFVVQDLDVIATYSGIFTILSYTVAPSMLWLVSRHVMSRKGFAAATAYSEKQWWVSSRKGAIVLLTVSTFAIAGVLVGALVAA